MLKRLTITGLIIATCLAVPLLVEWKTTKAPRTKEIHMEFFRYGSDPAIIRANRGDEINLTFSTQDTGHSFLIQDYRIEAKVSPASETVELRDPLDVDVPFEDVKEVKFIAGLKGWWGHLANVSRFRCHIYCGRMHGFEQGDLIVRPNVLFSGSIGLLVGLVIVSLMRALREDAYVRPISTSLDLNKRFRFLDKILKWRPLQFLCTLPVMAGFTLIVIAGFFGTKVGGRNIGVMLTWSVWMALLTMILVPFLGRSWCMLCPLPSLGEYLQRGATVKVRKSDGKGRYGNKFFGLG
ncbi:MAG: cupredoxin domain-containing protein, partial [Planctomycetota bacterium]